MTPTYGPFRLEVSGWLNPKTDFRIGSADQVSLYTDLPVLRWSQTQDGRPFIPGSSLRGVMRAHLEREYALLGMSKETILSLFGHAGNEREGNTTTYRGRLRVFDSIPDIASEEPVRPSYEIRDHVSIERATGTARDKAKFDAECISKYTQWKFPFKIVYEGENSADDEIILLGEALRALRAEELVIGSRSAIGCGRFQLTVESSRAFDRAQPQDLIDFLRYRLNIDSPTTTTEFSFPSPGVGSLSSSDQDAFHLLAFELDIRCNGPLLVRAGPIPVGEQQKRKEAMRVDAPTDATFVTTFGPTEDFTQVPYVPGSSLRGVLRHRAEQICSAQDVGVEVPMRLFGGEKGSLFYQRGRIRIENGVVTDILSVCSDHVAVDRITHAAARGAKFDDQALDGPNIQFRVHVDFTNDLEDLACAALLLLLIRDLTTESSGITLGSQTTRGYGSICPAKVTDISGSFHGFLANVIERAAATEQDRPSRTAFDSEKLGPKKLFEMLCDGFDEYWQRVRMRAITA